jgi:crotonobetainyl-CoA:carnitine CoA-transferase CaiB-like acyl-CoA transferase
MAPCIGQHSAQVLHEMLGYSAEAVRELEAQGVIA